MADKLKLTIPEIDSILKFIDNCNSMIVITEEDTLYIKLMNMRDDLKIEEAGEEMEDMNRE